MKCLQAPPVRACVRPCALLAVPCTACALGARCGTGTHGRAAAETFCAGAGAHAARAQSRAAGHGPCPGACWEAELPQGPSPAAPRRGPARATPGAPRAFDCHPRVFPAERRPRPAPRLRAPVPPSGLAAPTAFTAPSLSCLRGARRPPRRWAHTSASPAALGETRRDRTGQKCFCSAPALLPWATQDKTPGVCAPPSRAERVCRFLSGDMSPLIAMARARARAPRRGPCRPQAPPRRRRRSARGAALVRARARARRLVGRRPPLAARDPRPVRQSGKAAAASSGSRCTPGHRSPHPGPLSPCWLTHSPAPPTPLAGRGLAGPYLAGAWVRPCPAGAAALCVMAAQPPARGMVSHRPAARA